MSARADDPFAPHLRRNAITMGMDIALFVGGVNFSAWSTILPLFVKHLTGSNLVLGMLPAVRNLGLNLPPVLISGYVERLPRYKPFILWSTIMERLPFALLALAALALGTGHPLALLVIFFLLQAIWSAAGGVTNPAWLHLVSLMIPTRQRGRFFGYSSSLGGLIGVGAAIGAAAILRAFPFPRNFAYCFLATFVFLVASFIAIALCKEPVGAHDAPRRPATGMAAYLRGLPAFLRRERNFAVFLLASVLSAIPMAVSPFIPVAASRLLHVADAQVGVYTGVLLATSTVGSLAWGWLGDHAGYRPVLIVGSAAGLGYLVLALLALGAHAAPLMYGVYVLLGAYSSAIQLAGFTFVIEFGTAAERPTFIALSSLVQAPPLLIAPLLGGLVADHAGYDPIFIAAAVSVAAAIAVFIGVMRDPRVVGSG